MSREEPLDPAGRARLHASLPHGWRRMTVHAVALRVVEALDGDAVDPDDGRVWMVGRGLSACRWRSLTVAGLARQAAEALETWEDSRRRLDVELASLLD